MFLNREDAIEFMNKYGVLQKPFLFIIDFEQKNIFLSELQNISPNVLFDINGQKNYTAKDLHHSKIELKKYPVSFDKYKTAFEKVSKEIYDGNTYLLNLTFPTSIEINLTLEETFFISRAKYKLLFNDDFVVFSPECFIKIIDGYIYSYPMKGTIDGAIANAEAIILADRKEEAEHFTIVDLIRNDLSIVAKNVHVEKFRYVEKINTHEKTLLQVSSLIKGTLENNYQQSIGNLIFELLPAGSITGAPKKKTVEIIKSVEQTPRGFYTGIFGIFDGHNLDSSVMIRFIEKRNDEYIFKSGGGITYMSNVQSEYQELIDKVYVPIS